MSPAAQDVAPIAGVRQALAEHLPGFDPAIVEAVLAVMLTHRMDGPPVWMMLVAPPSAGKTFILEPCEGLFDAEMISKIGATTFLSGAWMSGGKDASLLTRLGERPLMIFKELGTLLTMDPKLRGEVFGQLREIFDGLYTRHLGTGDEREWRGRATVIAGFTSAVDLFHTLDSSLGDRFLKIRFVPAQDPVELAMLALESVGDESEGKAALHAAYQDALAEAEAALPDVALSNATKRRISNLAAMLARIRTSVNRDKYRQDGMTLPPQTEGTPRIAKTLRLLAQACAALRSEADLFSLDLLYRVTVDTMSEPRRSIFLKAVQLVDRPEGTFKAAELEGVVGKSQTHIHIDDLCVARVFSQVGAAEAAGAGRPAALYSLNPELAGWMKASGLADWLRSHAGQLERIEKVTKEEPPRLIAVPVRKIANAY